MSAIRVHTFAPLVETAKGYELSDGQNAEAIRLLGQIEPPPDTSTTVPSGFQPGAGGHY